MGKTSGSHEEKVVPRMRRTFFRDNLLTFLAMLFVPTIVLGLMSMHLLHGYIRKNLDDNAHLLLDQLVTKITLVTEQLEPLIRIMEIDGQSSYVARKLLDSYELSYTDLFLLDNIKGQLSSLRNTYEYIHSINVYFSNEHGFYLSDTGKHSLAPKDEHWFSSYNVALEKDKKVWTDLSSLTPSNQNKIEVLSIFNIIGNGEGVIVFNLRLDLLSNLLHRGLEDSGYWLLITDGEGQKIIGDWPSPENKNPYILQQTIKDPYGWKVTLISDKTVVYQVYQKILVRMSILSTVMVTIGIGLSFLFTQRMTRQVYLIIDLLDAASDGKELPEIPERQMSTYGYIVHQLVNTFIQKSYLKTQLEARKFKLKTAQLMALQAQLNPHFLFNTLEVINWKAYEITNKPNEVNEMIEHLSDLMRYSLSPVEEFVTLYEEVESIKNYLALQKIRYLDKLEAFYFIDDDAWRYSMPRMLLQPIFENIIYHGFQSKPVTGKIILNAKIVQDSLNISIQDNGIGMDAITLDRIRADLENPENVKTDHIGLANVNARLFLHYGTTLSVQSHQNKGTIVTMTIKQMKEEHSTCNIPC